MVKDFFERPFTLDRIARIGFSAILIVGIVYVVRSLSSILIPFALAWMLAYFLMPLVHFFERKLRMKYRLLSVGAVLILLASVTTGIVLLVLPSIVEEIHKSWELMNFYASTETLLMLLPERVQEFLSQYRDVEVLLKEFNLEKFINAAQEFLTQTWGLLSGTISFLMSFTVVFLFLLYLLFILLDYENLLKGLYRLIPERLHSFVIEAMDNIEFNINNYFKGQSLIALSVGVLLAIGFKIMGLPLGISLGLLIGLFNLIPYLQLLGIVPIVLLSALHSADTGQNFFLILGIALGILALVQVVQDTVLVPRIMGKSMGMRPAVILLALSVWGSLLGFLGLLFALPLTMTLYTYHMKYVVGKPINEGRLLERKKRSKAKKDSQGGRSTQEEETSAS